VNPLATITVLAKRAVEGVARKAGVEINYGMRNAALDLFDAPAYPMFDDQHKRAGMGFMQVLDGIVHVGGEIEEFGVAERGSLVLLDGLGARRGYLCALPSRLQENALTLPAQVFAATRCSRNLCERAPGQPAHGAARSLRALEGGPADPDTHNLTYESACSAPTARCCASTRPPRFRSRTP